MPMSTGLFAGRGHMAEAALCLTLDSDQHLLERHQLSSAIRIRCVAPQQWRGKKIPR